MTRTALILGLAVLALTPTASAALPNPCALLTNAEVAKAFGKTVVERYPTTQSRFRMCTWEGPALGSFTSARPQLTLSVVAETKKQFVRGANSDQGSIPVKGVGDVAYTSAGPAQFLNTWRKGYALMITISFGPPNALAAEKVAARAAVTRL